MTNTSRYGFGRRQAGFTLLETIIVLVVIAMMTAVIAPKVNSAIGHSRVHNSANVIAGDLQLAFSLASPLLHHLWFALYEGKTDLVHSFAVMATGDFCGTVTVLYAAKFLLARMAPARR